MGRWEPTPNPSQEGNMGRWGNTIQYGGLDNYQVYRIVFPLASCLLPLASCLLPLASCLPLLGGVRGGFLLSLAYSLLPAPCSLFPKNMYLKSRKPLYQL
ncbi:hypothetical protein [Moorena sp. SIO3H5]|uniref:hypothetical protein n=1 Tax=Moorena sp. SIO3H5 TaxID=2607834 RepID=UPI0013BB0AA9|nr:hypothetical protein [Moorena sp. SIO3H5]NEO69761.1 hypothetical protein [Moorena sp. SIO3H5]